MKPRDWDESRIVDFVCVLFDGRPGGVPLHSKGMAYDEEWVNKLYRGVRRNLKHAFRFHCITHFPAGKFDPAINLIPFKNDTRDWWCINEVLRDDLEFDRLVFCGLDTVICGPIDDLICNRWPCLVTMGGGANPNNGWVVWDGHIAREGGRQILAMAPGKRPKMSGSDSEMRAWEQVWWLQQPRTMVLYPDVMPGRILSFRREYRLGVYRRIDPATGKLESLPLDPEQVSVVYFHGRKFKMNAVMPSHPLREHWR